MKKSDFFSLGMMFVLFALSWLNIFLGYFTQYTLIIVLLVMCLIAYKTLGFHKNKSIIEKDVILSILAYLILYYLLTYILGFFTGFSKNVYDTHIINVFKNTFPVILTIIIGEVLRYMILHRTKVNKLVVVLSFLAFTLMNNTLLIRGLVVSENVEAFTIIEQLGLFVLPSVTTNILLTYLAIDIGYKSLIVYRLLMELPAFLIPIIPNFGAYIESVIRIAIPVIVFAFTYKSVTKNRIKSIVIIEKKKLVNLFRINVLLFSAILVYFISGLFRYQALVIATGSMTPNINIGDVVIVDKKKGELLDKLDVGDVIAYKKGNIVICHRIINIIKSNGEVYYETKGDYNPSADQILVSQETVVGIVNFKINYIGYPTVLLNQIIK